MKRCDTYCPYISNSLLGGLSQSGMKGTKRPHNFRLKATYNLVLQQTREKVVTTED